MIKPACENAFIIKKRNLRNDYYSLRFAPLTYLERCRPGHFVHILLPSTDILFRRAFSIADVSVENKELEIIFKAVGRGTSLLASLKKGDMVDILGPLGVPFKFPRKNENIVIIAGGIGFPPLLYLVKELVKKGHEPGKIEFFYGGRSTPDILDKSRIKKLGVSFRPVTEDGTMGEKGLVTAPVEKYILANKSKNMRIFSCGPVAMLKAVDALGLKYNLPGQISIEAPMPCGIGVCLGCVVPLVKGGHTRVCCDGPVYNLGEVVL